MINTHTTPAQRGRMKGERTMMIYHVCKRWDGYDLESMSERHGESEAIGRFVKRWPDAEELAIYHINYIHCWDKLDEALEYARGQRAQVLEIDTDHLDVAIDTLEFAHPMVCGSIPAEYIRKLKPTRQAREE